MSAEAQGVAGEGAGWFLACEPLNPMSQLGSPRTPQPSPPLGSSLPCPMMAVTVGKQPPVPEPVNELPLPRGPL